MVTIIDNVLTLNECEHLIKLGSKNFAPAGTLGKQIEGYRTADGSWLREPDEIVEKVKSMVSIMTGNPIENQEEVHIVKYEIGGEFKTHTDYFHQNEEYYSEHIKLGGQRIMTCLFYLNDNFEGGETEFPLKKLKITPRIGRLLLWSNVTPDDNVDYESLHAGLPVISGTKYIAVVWIRESKFKK
jgi:prolyl 4-hydroxylase